MALTTPIPQIELALDGLIDFTLKKNGAPPAKEVAPEAKPDPAAAANALAGWLRERAKKGK